jgi:uncharacterized short protein YbdD (DUF466 family)
MDINNVAIHDVVSGSSASDSKIIECKTMITASELKAMFDESSVASITPVIERIHTLIQNALKTAQAAKEMCTINNTVENFVTKKVIHPGQHLEKQCQFHRTTKSKRHTSKHVLK